MKEKTKPKYNVIQNVWWMTKIAWNTRRRVLLFCILSAGLEVLYNLTQLYIAPEILTRVEQHEPLGNLLAAIAFFTLALFFAMGAKDYISHNALFPRVEVRSSILGMLGWKNNTTSYPNTLKADFIKLREKADMASNSNNAAAEHIWETLTCLLQNTGGVCCHLLGWLPGVTAREQLAVHPARAGRKVLCQEALHPGQSGIGRAGKGCADFRPSELV